MSFCNTILNKGYYTEKWLNLVDVMLEKGKGPRLGKLQIISLIEGDLQMLIKIFLEAKDQELIENNMGFLKANYSSKRNYLIETAILQKD